ncbi:hypothetical protein ACIBEK_34590 [Nocardia fusca]|uniref:hypothetical protein n=1 Tax=Nocardia fusca TaxID=941183 RepID=UPI0037B90CA1
MIAGGAHMKTVQRRLGHKTASMTLDDQREPVRGQSRPCGRSNGRWSAHRRGQVWAKCGHAPRPPGRQRMKKAPHLRCR